MDRPTSRLSAAPTPLARRVVLGTAFLLALAAWLPPRIPAVQAQDTQPAPAASAKQPDTKSTKAAAPKTSEAKSGAAAAPAQPEARSAAVTAPKPPTTSKTVTISDGRGAQAKMTIEVKDPADAAVSAGDATDAEDSPPTGAGKAGSGGHNVSIGRHGRVKVDGLGADREFDSVGEFVHDEPAIATMVVLIVTVVFLSPVLAIGLILWYRIRKTRMLNETMLKLAEKGVVPTAEALEALAGGKQAALLASASATAPIYEEAKQIRRRAAWSDLRKGVIAGGIGLALTLFSVLDDRSPNSVGLVLLFVGIGYVVLWWFEERQLAPSSGAAPTGGGAPGAPPPAA